MNGILATGHGMWGLQLAPLTGRLVAQIATGEAPEHEIEPLRPDRFGRRARRDTAQRPVLTGPRRRRALAA